MEPTKLTARDARTLDLLFDAREDLQKAELALDSVLRRRRHGIPYDVTEALDRAKDAEQHLQALDAHLSA